MSSLVVQAAYQVMFANSIISELQYQSHNKCQYPANLLAKLQKNRETQHVWGSLPKLYNYSPIYLLTF